MLKPSYDHLFAFLESIDFEDVSPSNFERVFARDDLNVILAFSMLDDPNTARSVREADMLSAETRLFHHSLISANSLTDQLKAHHAEQGS